MRVLLLPRLKAHGVTTILDNFESTPFTNKGNLDVLRTYSALKSSAPSGGTKADDVAVAISAQLRRIAQKQGFPTVNTQSARAQFDQDAAIYLGQQEALMTGEALRDDVWAFMCAVLAPDVVAWRFTEQSRERYAGGVRNSFQRLWVRGTILDRGEGHPERWALIRELSEDAMVQIFERSSLGGNPSLALAIAEGWLKATEKMGRRTMEHTMRGAIKLLRLKNQIIDLAFLEVDELETIVSTAFEMAMSTKAIMSSFESQEV